MRRVRARAYSIHVVSLTISNRRLDIPNAEYPGNMVVLESRTSAWLHASRRAQVFHSFRRGGYACTHPYFYIYTPVGG